MKHIIVKEKIKHNTNILDIPVQNDNNILDDNIDTECITENIDIIDINNINKNLSLNNKKKIINTVKNLDEEQRIEIYKLIVNDTDKFTKKTDGIIVDLNNLSDDCLYKIYCYIKYNDTNNITEI